ncbi:MAG TPA: glycine C-acetyltransferase, partial [Bacteroidia bacterium]|nr:glycine C-acetyltransferase [Bacteroidia bacterium]
MYGTFKDHLQNQLNDIEANGLFKRERVITTPQGASVKVNGKDVIIFCANNYLGLSSHPKVIEGAKKTLDSHGYGMSSVRFI